MEKSLSAELLFFKDCLVALFMYLDLYILSPWRLKKRNMLLILGVTLCAQICGLYFACHYADRCVYDMIRTMLQALPFLLSPFLMKGKGIRTLLPVITSASVVTVCSVAMIGVMSLARLEISKIIIIFFLQLAGLLLCVVVLKKPLLQMLRSLNEGWWPICICTGLPVLIFTLISAFPTSTTEYATVMLPIVGMAVIIIGNHVMIFTLYEAIKRQYHIQEEKRVMQIQLSSTEAQINKTRDSREEICVLSHDLRHYANLIGSEIQNGNTEAAMETTGILLMKIDEANGKAQVNYCENIPVNIMLNHYVSRAAALDVTVDTQIMLSDSVPGEEIELAMVLANCLENAVNALAKIPKGSPRKLRIVLRTVGTQLFMEIENNFDGEIEIDEETSLPITNRPGHGIGMSSVETYVRKHKAFLDCTHKDGIFVIRIVI
ncbi:MAG: GHKL domain-containing protein [Oscillospiraceae bacterium]